MSQEKEKKLEPRANIDDIEETQEVERDDKQAKKEEENLFQKRAKKRKDSKKTHIHLAFLALIWVGFSLVVVTLLSRVYHMLAPECYFWLTKTQIEQMDQILFSGLIGGFLGRYLHNVIKDHQD